MFTTLKEYSIHRLEIECSVKKW